MHDCLVTASCSFDRPVRTGDVLKLQVVLSPGRLFPGRAKTGACEQGLRNGRQVGSCHPAVASQTIFETIEKNRKIRGPHLNPWYHFHTLRKSHFLRDNTEDFLAFTAIAFLDHKLSDRHRLPYS